MVFPQRLFQKYLDGEISSEQYKNGFKQEALTRFAILTTINIIALFNILQFSYPKGGWQVSFWVGFLSIALMYIAVAAAFSYLFYRDEKKNSLFFISVKEENEQSAIKNNKATIVSKIPRKAAKLYLKGEISKFEYVYSASNWPLNLIRYFFIFSFGAATILLWSGIDAGFLTKISAGYLAAFFVTFFIHMQIAGPLKAIIKLTLKQKEKQHEAFHHAENIIH